MPLEAHQIQPGAVDQDRNPLWLTPDDDESDASAVRVVDKIQAVNGSYLIVADEAGVHALLPEATVTEGYSAREADAEPDPELERLREENQQLRAQQTGAQQTGEPDTTAPEPGAQPATPGQW